MKTAREWAKELTPKQEKQALRNMSLKKCGGDETMAGRECESLVGMLRGAFIWDLTPQGHKYWAQVLNSMENEK